MHSYPGKCPLGTENLVAQETALSVEIGMYITESVNIRTIGVHIDLQVTPATQVVTAIGILVGIEMHILAVTGVITPGIHAEIKRQVLK